MKIEIPAPMVEFVLPNLGVLSMETLIVPRVGDEVPFGDKTFRVTRMACVYGQIGDPKRKTPAPDLYRAYLVIA